MNTLFTELRRRNIFRVAGVYAVVGWILMQVVSVMTPALALPDWVDSFFAILLLIGFPIALLLAWAFEMTPEGMKRTEIVAEGESVTAKTGRRLDYVIVAGLVLVAALVIWQGTRSAPILRQAQDEVGGQAQDKVRGQAQDKVRGQAQDEVGGQAQDKVRGQAQDEVGGQAQDKVGVVAEENPHPELVEGSEGTSKDADTTPGPSIAVLPFEDFSSEGNQEYFAKGISEELLNVLARIDGLRVASRTSSFALKDRDASMDEIAEALNVGHILEGSIRKAGATLRITAQLIDTANDEHLWSETYDRPLTAENIFAIQDEIAAAIVGNIKGRLSVAQTSEAAKTASLEAYELYLRAREQMIKRLPDTLRAAVEGFQQVIALDPGFAPAYAGLADTYLLMRYYTDMSEEESLSLAKPHVARALELAPDSAEALTSAALFANAEIRPEEAVALAERAIVANPNYADAFLRKGNAYSALGDLDKALIVFQKARALDPLSPVILANIADVHLALGNRGAAKQIYRDLARWNPDSPFGQGGLGSMLFEDGDLAGAHSLYKDAQALNPDAAQVQSTLVEIYGYVGLLDKAEAVARSTDDRALNYFLRGDNSSALALFDADPDNAIKGFFLYFMGNYSAAYADIQARKAQINWAERQLDPSYLTTFASVAFIYQHAGDAEAEVLVEKFDAHLGTNGPVDNLLVEELQAGAIVQMVKNKPKKAYDWIDAFLDRGFADNTFLRNPAFDDLRDTPEFAAREKRMAENVARHRAAIEAQLANPKENWVK